MFEPTLFSSALQCFRYLVSYFKILLFCESLTDLYRYTYFHSFCASYFSYSCLWSFLYPKESSLTFFCKAGLLVMNSFNLFWETLYLSFYSPSWIEYYWLKIFPFSNYIMPLPAVSAEESDSFMESSLYETIFFSFVALKILCLSLLPAILMIMCLGVELLRLILLQALCASWIWISVSFPRCGNFLTIISSNKIFALSSISLLFWDSYNVNVIILDGVTEFPKSIFIFCYYFSLSCSA